MTAREGTVSALKLVLGTLLPVAVVAVSLYLFYVRYRADYLTSRNYRFVVAVSGQIGARIGGARTALETAGRSSPKNQAPAGRDRTCPLPDAARLECARVDSVAVPSRPASRTGGRVYIRTEEAVPALYFAYDRRCDRAADGHDAEAPKECDALANCGTSSADGSSRMCTRIPVAQLVGPLLNARGPFDAFVIVAGNRVVLTSPGVTGGFIEELQKRLGQPDPNAEAQGMGTRLVANFARPKGTRTVRLRDQDVYLFSEPLDGQIDVDGSPGTGQLELYGLVERRRFDEERGVIPHRWLVPLLLIVVLAALAWPVLKVWYMGPRERLSGMDVRILVLSTVVGAGLIAFAVRSLSTEAALTELFDGQLDELAGQIDRQLRSDVTGAHDQLEALVSEPTSIAGTRLAYNDIEAVVLVNEAGEPQERWRPVPDASSGWALESIDAPKLTLTDRRYFQDAQGGRFLAIEQGGEAPRRYAAEMVHSRTTGDSALVLAVRTSSPETRVALVTMRLTALRNPVLPYGFGFALIDSDGIVQLHSDPQRALVENFFDEIEPDKTLRAAVSAGARRTLSVSYGGTEHRLRVQPLDYLRWSLLVFRDRRLVQAVDEEIFTLWSTLFAFYVLVLLVVLAGTQILHDGYRAAWLWPDRTHAAIYAAAVPRVVVAGIVGYRLAEFQSGLARGAMLLCVIAAVVGMLCLRLGKRRIGATDVEVTTPWERRAASAAALGGLAVAAGLTIYGDRPGVPLLVALAVLSYAPLRWPPDGCELIGLGILGAAAGAGFGSWPAWIAPAIVAIALPAWCPALAVPGRMRRAVTGGRLERWVRRLRAPIRSASARMLLAVRPAATEGTFRFGYVATMFALLVLIAVLPSIVFYEDARQWTMNGLAPFGQRDFVHRADSRNERLRAEHIVGQQPDWVLDQRLKSPSELYCTSWVAAPDTLIGRSGGHEPAAAVISSRIGFLSEPVPELQLLAEQQLPIRTKLETCSAHDTYPGDDPIAPAWQRRTWVGLVWLAAGVLTFALLWSIARLVFLLDLDRGDPGTAASAASQETLSVWTFANGPDQAVAPREPSDDALIIDLRFGATKPQVDDWTKVAGTKSFVEIDHLESVLDDVEAHSATLGMIESFVQRGGRPLVLVSEVDPIRYLAARVAEPRAAGTDEPAPAAQVAPGADELLARWSRVLDVFARRRWEVPPAPSAADRQVADILARKYPQLDTTRITRDDDIDEIGEARYWQIWSQCTRAERLALRHLAEEGFLNPNSIPIVRPLVRRLLVRRDPAFSMPSEAFRRFTLRAERPETIATWETEGVPSGWSRLRTPLVALSLLIAIYVFLAERDLFDSSVAVAAGVTAGLPAILKLLGLLGDQRAGVRSG